MDQGPGWERGILWVAGLGLFVSTLDTGVINIALPTLQSVWKSPVPQVTWTVTVYAITLTATMMLWGRWADRIGRVSIFLWGLFLFGVSSALCGASSSLSLLIAARAVQGLSAAMVQATAASLVTTTVAPERRNVSLGALAVFQGLGPIAGPSVGGLVLSVLSWRWLFWINLPVIAVTWTIGYRLRHHVPRTRGTNAQSVIGNAWLTITVFTMLLAISGDISADMRLVWVLLATAGGLGLWLSERLNRAPIIPHALWRNRTFAVSLIGIATVGGATSLGFLIPPFVLERMQKMSPSEAGFVNMAAPLGLILLSRPAGRWIMRVGAMRLAAVGLLVMAVSFGTLALLSPLSPVLAMAALLFSYGMGAGLFFPSNLSSLLGAAGTDVQSTLGAVQRMGLNLGTAVDTTVGSSLLSLSMGAATSLSVVGVRAAWTYGTLTLALAFVLAIRAMASEKKCV